MTGDQHYAEAERILAEIQTAEKRINALPSDELVGEGVAHALTMLAQNTAEAQVHATLAVAAGVTGHRH